MALHSGVVAGKPMKRKPKRANRRKVMRRFS